MIINPDFLDKVGGVPNMPPGVTPGVIPPQYMIGNPSLPPFFAGLQQPHTMYPAAYGSTALDNLAALQRDAGIHTLVGAAAQQSAAAAAAAAIGSGSGSGSGTQSSSQSAAKSAAVTIERPNSAEKKGDSWHDPPAPPPAAVILA